MCRGLEGELVVVLMALGGGGGVVLSFAAIIRLSLGDRLINVAFLQLTSKVTGIGVLSLSYSPLHQRRVTAI